MGLLSGYSTPFAGYAYRSAKVSGFKISTPPHITQTAHEANQRSDSCKAIPVQLPITLPEPQSPRDGGRHIPSQSIIVGVIVGGIIGGVIAYYLGLGIPGYVGGGLVWGLGGGFFGGVLGSGLGSYLGGPILCGTVGGFVGGLLTYASPEAPSHYLGRRKKPPRGTPGCAIR